MNQSKIYLIGFSAGSNLVNKLIINNNRRTGFLRAAVGVCINSNYNVTRANLEASWVGYIYSCLITMEHKVRYHRFMNLV